MELSQIASSTACACHTLPFLRASDYFLLFKRWDAILGCTKQRIPTGLHGEWRYLITTGLHCTWRMRLSAFSAMPPNCWRLLEIFSAIHLVLLRLTAVRWRYMYMYAKIVQCFYTHNTIFYTACILIVGRLIHFKCKLIAHSKSFTKLAPKLLF